MSEFRSRVLTFEEWPLVRPILTNPAEFDNGMPTNPEQSTFPVLMDGDKLAAFLLVEHLLHFNSVYVVPEYRNQGCAQRLIRSAVASIPPGHSAIWITPTDVHGIAHRFGFRELAPSRIYRKDVADVRNEE